MEYLKALYQPSNTQLYVNYCVHYETVNMDENIQRE